MSSERQHASKRARPSVRRSTATAVTPAARPRASTVAPRRQTERCTFGEIPGFLATESLFNDLMQEVQSKGVAGDMMVYPLAAGRECLGEEPFQRALTSRGRLIRSACRQVPWCRVPCFLILI